MSGSGDKEMVSIPSITSCFANLIIAADNLAKEQASAIIDPNWAKKLKKLADYTRLLVEKFPKTSNGNTKLRGKQKEDVKFWERVQSDFYSIRNSCGRLTQTMEFFADQLTETMSEKDKVFFENSLRSTFYELYTLDDHLKSVTSRLLSSETILRNRMSNVIDANYRVTFLRQLDLALMSNSMMVILFHLSWIKDCKYFLPQFVDLADQYQHYHGDKIKFMRVNVKVLRCKRFEVISYPTVVVIKGDGQEAGRVSISETIIVPAFVAGLKVILDDCLGVEDD